MGCVTCYPFIAKRGQKYGRSGTHTPSMKLYLCVGSLGMYTLLLVCTCSMWLVEIMRRVCMLMGGHIVVYAGSVHSCWGVKNVIWCVG